jgi:hypothetical protein
MLEENRSANEADQVVDEAYKEVEDSGSVDEEYERQRRKVADNRKRLMARGLDQSFDELSAKIEGLHAFYSVLRNLENIDAIRKEEMLDRILDFHIYTNFYLIDFYFKFSKNEEFRTFAAYMLTWSGHGFMASSLGNPSMCDSIIEVAGKTTNDFKRLLLLLLLSQLGDDRACSMIENFLSDCKSRAATEILFVHVRRRLVEHQSRKLPIDLINLFKKLFVIRQTKYGGAKTETEAKAQLGKVLSQVNVEHMQRWRDIGALELSEVAGNGDDESVVNV